MRAACLLVAFAVGAPLEAQTLHYEGSAGLATGSYIFTTRTSSWHVATGLALGAGPVTLRATLPVFYQNSTLIATTGTGLVPTGGSSGGAVADSGARRSVGTSRRLAVASPVVFSVAAGLAGDPVEVPTSAADGYQWATGDPVVGLTVAALRSGRLGLSVGASAKIPVTDTASFGTGAWDFGGTLSSSLLLSAHFFVGFDVGYWAMGDTPALDLDNPVLLGGSLSYLSLSGWSISAGVSGSTPVIAGFAESVSATLGVLRSGRAGLGVLLTAGLTETAPDIAVALSWRLGLLRP
jgi:hypothetical protein